MNPGRAARVAVAVQHYPPYIAGAELQARLLARQLAATLGACDVVTTRFRPDLPLRSLERNVSVHRLRTLRGRHLRKAANFVSAFAYFLTTRRNYDVVHTFCLSPFSLGAILAARLRGVRTIVRPCTRGAQGEIATARSLMPGGFLWALFRRADVFVVQTPGMAPELLAAGVPADRIVHVPNMLGSGLEAENDPDFRRDARARLGLPDRPTVLFVGRLIEAKGVDVLAAAWERVAPKHDASLVLVGDGPLAGPLRDGVRASGRAGSVFLAGQRTDPERYYRAADVFVFPSREEGFGNVLAEAMAFGLAVVSRPVGFAADAIEHGRNGLLVPGSSPAAFAEAIDRLLRDREYRERLGREARQTALRRFAPDVVTRAVTDLYWRLGAGPRHPAAGDVTPV